MFQEDLGLGRQPNSTYVDITTPNRRTADVFEFVDLDLDVEAVGAGPATVLDRDEFTDHARAWAYPTRTVIAAEATCDLVAAALTNRTAPFDGAYLAWWRVARDSVSDSNTKLEHKR